MDTATTISPAPADASMTDANLTPLDATTSTSPTASDREATEAPVDVDAPDTGKLGAAADGGPTDADVVEESADKKAADAGIDSADEPIGDKAASTTEEPVDAPSRLGLNRETAAGDTASPVDAVATNETVRPGGKTVPDTASTSDTASAPAKVTAPTDTTSPDGATVVRDDTSAPLANQTQVKAQAVSAPQSGWVTEGGKTHYYGTDGKKLTGKKTIDGMTYCFDEDGALQTGQQLISGSWYYFDPDKGGAMAFDRFVYLDKETNKLDTASKTVFYGTDGKMDYGQLWREGKWFFLDFSSGARAENQFAYLDKAQNELDTASKTCFYDAAGQMAYGQQQVNNSWYYLDPSSGARAESKFVYLDKQANELDTPSKTVYYGDDGRMAYGQAGVNGLWYYLDPSSGARAENTFVYLDRASNKLDTPSKWVYYQGDGSMAHGTTFIGDENYWFDPSTGASSYAQCLRWRLHNASGTTDLAFFNGGSASATSLDALRQAMGAFASRGYAVGFVMMDLTTGRGISSDADGVYYSASTVKAPYVTSVYEKAFDSNLGSSGAWYGTLEDICVWSDNDAYFNLRNTFGSDIFASWLYEAGVNPDRANSYYAFYSPRDLGKMWLRMYDYFGQNSAGQQLAGLLSHGYYSSIYNELGSQYAVASKAGWYPTEYPYTSTNDAGIVYAGNHPYLLSVLSTAPVRLDLTQSLVHCLDTIHQEMVR